MAFDFPSSPTELQLYAPTGGPTYRYVAPGWRVVDSGTASFDADSKAIFNAFTTPPTPSRKDLIDACVKSLKTGGVWDKLDALYAFAAADAQAAKINWKNPGTFNCTEVNAPTFTADGGFLGASTKYLDTGFNPATAPSPKFVRNSASAFVWGTSTSNINAGAFGSIAAGAGRSYIYPHSWDGGLYVTLNQNSWVNVAVAGGEQLAASSRTDANTVSGFINGVSVVSNGAKASEAPINGNFAFLTEGGNYYTAIVRGGGFGSQLSTPEQLALYNALNAYMTGLAIDRIFAAFTTPPSAARKTLITNCVNALVAAGVWNKLDALYAFAAADSQAALVNWKQPGTFNGTLVNAPAFTADRGFTGASTKYIDTGFNPTTAPSPKFVQNDACLIGWSLTVGSSGDAMVGTTGADTINAMLPNAAGIGYFFINGSNYTGWGSVTDGSGLFVGVRTGAADQRVYRNGSLITNSGITSSAPASANLAFLKRQSSYWSGQIAAGGFGSQLSVADNTALYNALKAYMDGLAADRIFAAFTTPPSDARKTLIRNCVTSLQNAGIWDKLDALYLFAAADSQAALINWVNPGTYNATNVNSAAFVADRGFTGASTAYIDTGFNPSTATTPKYVLNSASAGVWILTNLATDGLALGTLALGTTAIFPRYSSAADARYFRINQAASTQFGTTATSVGLTAISRTGASAIEGYFNGASIGTAAPASSAVPTTNILLVVNVTGIYAGQVAANMLGSSLSAADNTALYNALRTYLTGVGVP